ncbi:hypothetical protein WICPIJ_008463 [Wickerhamomyces pijperi]|uniref:Bacteriophage T5 Orf172 DNA-binding domain-containing protein n=1 Tax=Wickerhamomyces pijperi TaxID=599730 RepID=A0A9P8PXH4_WICPI|nr:hypothetical protein WICPIJ_008463 [Wickerhamomyces pijperi]
MRVFATTDLTKGDPTQLTKVQCLGVTQKGTRCQIRVTRQELRCVYHKKPPLKNLKPPVKKEQQSIKIGVSPDNDPYATGSLAQRLLNGILPGALKEGFVEHDLKAGYIYMYTLQHLLGNNPGKQDWLQLKPRDSSVWKVFNPKELILIKIGMTTKLVSQRLKEWENLCHHKLTSVDPYALKSKKLFGLITKNAVNHKVGLRYYHRESQGFYTDVSLSIIEKKIHQTLWKKYGKGDIVCHGCKSAADGGGIHKEWFLVPRSDLGAIFEIISDIVGQHNH